MKISKNWLQTFFEKPLPSPEVIAEKITFGAFEIESVDVVGEDTVIDVKILPNRAHDCLSHRGIARELSALLSLPLTRDPLACPILLADAQHKILLSVDDVVANPVHTLALITGVKVGPSPQWLASRLETLGQRSINNIVDATNYVMLDMGQPTHAFDWDKLTEKDGKRGIRVRPASEGETITLLGGQEKTLSVEVQVLSDANSGVALDIAGIKGGIVAELTNDTQNVLITAAKFNPTRIRRTAQKLKIRTDASHRFENEIPDVLPYHGLREVVQLITDLAGGVAGGVVSIGTPETEQRVVTTSVVRVNAVLGLSLTEDTIANILARLGFIFTHTDGVFSVTPPQERLDLTIEEDLIEEIGRTHGYDLLPETPLPPATQPPQIDAMFYLKDVVRSILNELGFTEVLSYSLRAEGHIELANALASDKGHLRDNLTAGITEALNANDPRTPFVAEYTALRIFEIGNVFTTTGEQTSVCIGVRALGMKKRAERTQEFLRMAEEALAKNLAVPVDTIVRTPETLEFSLSAVVPSVQAARYLSLPHVASELMYTPLSVYPFVSRDIAFWAPDGVTEQNICAMLRELAGPLLIRIDLFDSFSKEGKTSYAYHLILQSHEKTLREDDIVAVMQGITAEIEKKGYVVR